MPKCRTCGEEFENFRDLTVHKIEDDCKELVKQHIEIYEDPQLEQHQKDLADYADWGND